MISYTETYEKVKATRRHNGKCPICGGKVSRSKTFSNTISPYNRNDDGSVRTRKEVWLNVNRIADEWVPDFRHAACIVGEKEVPSS